MGVKILHRENFAVKNRFQRTIRKFLDTLAVDIEGIRHHPNAYLTNFFRVNVPLTLLTSCHSAIRF
jgi:hypothetical protein